MGNGVFSRRQRKIFQSLLAVTVIFGMIYGGMVSYEMHKQLKRTEALALKYQQHQESLSAQLQGKHMRTYVEGFPTTQVYVLCSVRKCSLCVVCSRYVVITTSNLNGVSIRVRKERPNLWSSFGWLFVCCYAHLSPEKKTVW